MPDARTPRKWTYRAAKPIRSRVIKQRDPEQRGVRRRVPQEAASRMTPGQARLLLAAAMLACLAAAAWWLYQSPYLTVREVTVTGAEQIPPEAIVAASGLEGDSAFRLDLDAAQARVAALPKVRSATIEKHGWTGISIHIEERIAWGSWQIDGINVPVDIDGYVLDGPPAPEGSPVIVEADAQRVINAGERLDPGAIQLAARLVQESDTAFGRHVMALIYRRTAGLTAVFAPPDVDGRPLWVTFGDSRDYDYKIAALYVLLEQAKEQDLSLSAVDLRFGDRLSFN